MSDHWKNIWENREQNCQLKEGGNSRKNTVLELKRLNGFDVLDGGLQYASIIKQYKWTKRELMFSREKLAMSPLKSVFEIGCGSGANLFMFEEDGIEIGGIDYSSTLVKIAQEVLPNSKEILCGEAIQTPTEQKYDGIFANSVFSYFKDFDYAEEVLHKMLLKSKRSIGILDIHDANKKEQFTSYRRQTIEDYDEKYKNLDKLFYPKDFFIKFAEKNNLDIKFSILDLPDYWNNEFIFHCFMYR